MTLHLSTDLLEQLLIHCHAEHPLEACGLLPGRDDQPLRHRPMRNASDTPARRYEFDVAAELAEYRAMDDAGENPIVIYHSHTASPAVPSMSDVANAHDPDVHYLIVSTHDGTPISELVRSWRLVDGGLVEEPIVVAAKCG